MQAGFTSVLGCIFPLSPTFLLFVFIISAITVSTLGLGTGVLQYAAGVDVVNPGRKHCCLDICSARGDDDWDSKVPDSRRTKWILMTYDDK